MSKIKEDDALKCKEFISTNDIKLFVHSSYLFNTGAVPSEYSINTGVDDIQWIDKMGGLGAFFIWVNIVNVVRLTNVFFK